MAAQLPPDLLRSTAALALQVASPQSLKPLVVAGRFSTSKASKWRKHGFGPLGDLTQLLWHLAGNQKAQAYAVIAHLHTILQHRQTTGADEDLIARFDDAYAEAVGSRSHLKRVFFRYVWPRSNRAAELPDLRRAALEAATSAEELAALCLELERRQVEPRDVYEARRQANGFTNGW